MNDAEPKPRKSVSCHNPWCGGNSLCSYCDPKPKPVVSSPNPSGDADVREAVARLVEAANQTRDCSVCDGDGEVQRHDPPYGLRKCGGCDATGKRYVLHAQLREDILALTGNASTDRASLDAEKLKIAVQNGVARSMAEDEQWLELSGPARAVLMLSVTRHVSAALLNKDGGAG